VAPQRVPASVAESTAALDSGSTSTGYGRFGACGRAERVGRGSRRSRTRVAGSAPSTGGRGTLVELVRHAPRHRLAGAAGLIAVDRGSCSFSWERRLIRPAPRAQSNLREPRGVEAPPQHVRGCPPCRTPRYLSTSCFCDASIALQSASHLSRSRAAGGSCHAYCEGSARSVFECLAHAREVGARLRVSAGMIALASFARYAS